MSEPLLYDDLFMCNCCRCDQELLGLKNMRHWERMDQKQRVCRPMVAGYIGGRPYCPGCSAEQARKAERVRHPNLRDDRRRGGRVIEEADEGDNPWLGLATRHMEESA